MSKDNKLISEAYSRIYAEAYVDPDQLLVNLVAAITAGSTMFGGAVSPDADNLNARTISKIVHCIENGTLDKKLLFKVLVRAKRENGRAFASLVNSGERASYEGKETFTKHVLPLAKKILNADANDLSELEAAENEKDYWSKRVDHS
jgi:hypothetical protein